MTHPTNGAAPLAPFSPGSHAAPPPAIPAATKAAVVAALSARDGCAPAFDLARALDLSLAELDTVLGALKAEGVVEVNTAVHLKTKGPKR